MSEPLKQQCMSIIDDLKPNIHLALEHQSPWETWGITNGFKDPLKLIIHGMEEFIFYYMIEGLEWPPEYEDNEDLQDEICHSKAKEILEEFLEQRPEYLHPPEVQVDVDHWVIDPRIKSLPFYQEI